jgi:hypothetical protein
VADGEDVATERVHLLVAHALKVAEVLRDEAADLHVELLLGLASLAEEDLLGGESEKR